MTLDVEGSIVVLAPEDAATFDPASLVKAASSIYQGDLTSLVKIDDDGLSENRTEAGYAPGLYTLTYSVEDEHGNASEAKAYVQVVDGDIANLGSDNVSDAGGSAFKAVSLWNGLAEVPYEHGIFQGETREATFDIEGKGYTYLDAWVGINGSVRANTQYGMNGKIQAEVWATVRNSDGSTERVNLYTSPIMGWYATQEHVLVPIPENVVSISLRNVGKGGGNNHAAWGNPRLYTSEVLSSIPTPPTVSGIEDGASYPSAVSPSVSGAEEVKLYRKNLPVIVDTETGLPVSSDGNVETLSASADWGTLVEGYSADSEISEEGVYTLVASNGYHQKTIVMRLIGLIYA